MNNNDIRIYALENGVKMWRIAQELGIRDSSFSRKLRKELSDDEKKQIRDIIDRLSQLKAV